MAQRVNRNIIEDGVIKNISAPPVRSRNVALPGTGITNFTGSPATTSSGFRLPDQAGFNRGNVNQQKKTRNPRTNTQNPVITKSNLTSPYQGGLQGGAPYNTNDVRDNTFSRSDGGLRLNLGGATPNGRDGNFIDAPASAFNRLGDNKGSLTVLNKEDSNNLFGSAGIRSDTQGAVMAALRAGSISPSEAERLFNQAGQGADFQQPQQNYDPTQDYITALFNQANQGINISAPLGTTINQMASRNTARKLLPQFLGFAQEREKG